MPNALYPKYKESVLQSGVNLSTGAVKAMLVDLADYTYSATHQFLSDVPAAAREEISAALTGKTFANGVFDSDNPSFPGAVGDPCEALILFVDTGVATTSPLVLFLDTGVTGLPVTPNSGDINVTVNASGWFAL